MAEDMKVFLSPKALKWMRDKKWGALTIREIVAMGGCCGGGIKGILVEKGEPDDGKRYAVYNQEGIRIHVPGNIPPKTDAITVVLKGLVFKYLDIEGYEPRSL